MDSTRNTALGNDVLDSVEMGPLTNIEDIVSKGDSPTKQKPSINLQALAISKLNLQSNP